MTKTDWPDWRGATVAIVASGESAKAEKLYLLAEAHIYVIAIKKSLELVPFADAVYGCDGAWWRSVQHLPKFTGYKWAYEPTVCNSETGIANVKIKDKLLDKMVFDEVGSIGSGGNSGFQALNLAVQFGAKRILLVGFDMVGTHWYGANNWAMCGNPGAWNFTRWIKAFHNSVSQLSERGVEVINASSVSQISCFPKMSVEKALQQWGISQDAA